MNALSIALLAALCGGVFAGFLCVMQPRRLCYPNLPMRALTVTPADNSDEKLKNELSHSRGQIKVPGA
jgi:hypothetical protein